MRYLPNPATRIALAGALLVMATAARADGPDERFAIDRFDVRGNHLLSDGEVQRLVAPDTGPARGLSDISQAISALQAAYREHGYAAVRVTAPEQELTGGVVRIDVQEGRLGKVTVKGNLYFDEANVRASLPGLAAGSPPNLRRMSDAVLLANDNPAKQVAVSLAPADAEGGVDATVEVTDYKPLRLIASVDDTGTRATGNWRTGLAIQHANLFGLDHVATLAYTGSPDSPAGVHVNLYSAGYRIPLYALGASLDLLYGRSSVNVPGASPTLGGVLGFTGKGQVFGLHANVFLARDGETTRKLVLGFDRKETDSSCDIGGVAVDVDAPTPPIAACVPYTTQPISLTYSSQRQGTGSASDFFLAVAHNLATGARHTNVDGRVDRYSYLTPGNRDTRDHFTVLRAGGSYLQALGAGWQARLVANAQFAPDATLMSERFGLTGSQAVRGFQERTVTADSGVFANLEAITPNLGERLYIPGELRGVGFVDAGHGLNRHTAGTAVPASVSVASIGAGLRAGFGRDFSVRLDLARVVKAGDAVTESAGEWNAHIAATFAY